MIKNCADLVRAIGFFALLFGLAAIISGCGIPFAGTDEIEIPGIYRVKFSKGIDFHTGMNSIGRVDNRRGVFPDSEYSTAKQVKY